MQAADQGRNQERRTKEQGIYSAPITCQVPHLHSFSSSSLVPSRVNLLSLQMRRPGLSKVHR